MTLGATVVGSTLAAVLTLYIFILIGRLIFDYVFMFARDWHPTGVVLLLVEALCAGCSASFDEGGFAGGGGENDGGNNSEDEGPAKNAEGRQQRRRAGLLGLPLSRVEEAASRVVSVGPVALLSPGCRSAALRALAATGLPPLGGSKRSRGGGGAGAGGAGGSRNCPAPPRGPLPALLLPASMAEGASEDPSVAAAASALAPLVAEAWGGGSQGGERCGVEALYRVLLARAAASSSSSSSSISSSPAARPCFVALHTTAASLVAHARAGGGDVRSCVPSEMLPEVKKKEGSGAGIAGGGAVGPSASAAAETWPFLEMVKAIMKREAAPAADHSTAAAVTAAAAAPFPPPSAALIDAVALSAALQGAASRVSSRAAALAAAAIDDKVRQALASLREVEAAAEAVGGAAKEGGGCSAAAVALDEVAAAAQRLKRRCV